MAKLWRIFDVHPLKLCPCGPAEVPDKLLVVPMDATPRGRLERRRPDPLAYVIPRGRKVIVQLMVGDHGTEVERTPVQAGKATPGSIVFAPGDGYWDAYLVLPVPKRVVDRPLDVDRHFWQSYIADQIRHGADAKPPAKHWALAWSIYCAHIAPGSEHCRKPAGWYLTG